MKHAPDCNCRVCQPYDEWLGVSLGFEFRSLWRRLCRLAREIERLMIAGSGVQLK